MGSFPSKMEFYQFSFLFLAVAGVSPPSTNGWADHANKEKECTRYRIWAKAVFEGGFPAKVVLGIPATFEMTDKVAKMNVRKGCREMCGGMCQYRGEDLFSPDLCEEFEGGGVKPPQKIKKPGHEDPEGPGDEVGIMPVDDIVTIMPVDSAVVGPILVTDDVLVSETSLESEGSSYYEWDPFWWMEAEKDRIEEEKQKLEAEGQTDFDYMKEVWWSEGSSDWSWGSYSNSWEYYGYDHSWAHYENSYDSIANFTKIDHFVHEFENTWQDYKWDDFWIEPHFDEIKYEEIKVPEWHWEDQWWMTEGSYKPKPTTMTTMTSMPPMTSTGFTSSMPTAAMFQPGLGNFQPFPDFRKMKRAMPEGLQNYMANYACGVDMTEDVSPECKKAQEDFENADGFFAELGVQSACMEHCGQACGFLVNSISFMLLLISYLLFH